MKLRSILYAEDNPMDIDLTLEALKDNNILNPITVVNDGVEALEYLRREGKFRDRPKGNPGLILLDLKMPRMDGLEFIEIVRKDPTYSGVPIVLLTSSREEKDLMMSYRLGANAYVVKPIDFESFIKVVKNIGAFWAIINELPSDEG